LGTVLQSTVKMKLRRLRKSVAIRLPTFRLLTLGMVLLALALEAFAEGAGAQASQNSLGVFDRSGSTQTNVPQSIPRFFRKGEIANYAQPSVNGTPATVWQCDGKNRWDDGSLKFAIVSLIIPQIPSHHNVTISFINNTNRDSGSKGDAPTGYLSKSEMLDPQYDFEAVIGLTGAVSHTISARAMLDKDKFRYWLQGPVVTAVIVEDRSGRAFDVNTDGHEGNPLHPIFECWFYPGNHKVEVGFTVENSWASSNAPNSARNQDYALTLSTGLSSPSIRLNQPSFTQYSFTRWRRAYWIGSDPPAVRFDWNSQYLASTTAYPNWYSVPNEGAVSSMYAAYTRLYPARVTIPGLDDLYGTQHHGPGGIVNFDQDLDAGGDSDWIGLANTWDVMYLLTGDLRLKKMMTDNADLAGRFPLWFREADAAAGSGKHFDAPLSGSVSTQGRVVSINARQQVTLMLSNWHPGCAGAAADNINVGSPFKYGGWPSLDTSHIPDWAYLPYTLTGKYYYLEQLQMEAAYILGFYTGCYDLANEYFRQGTLGLFTRWPRDEAWAMRTVAYAAFASPDGNPEGPYFRDKLQNTIAMFEGAHGLPNDYPSRAIPYSWGKTTWQSSQAKNPSPLGAWQIDSATQIYAANGRSNNVNPNIVSNAGSMFMEAFLTCSLGMVRQLGIADTKPLLAFLAKRYVPMLLDPAVNHYLIEEYVYPSQLKPSNQWVADWATFQSAYLVLPRGWAGPGTSGNLRGFYSLSAVSYLSDITVDGYSGLTAWNWFKRNKPCQGCFPKWSIAPLQPK